MRSCSVMCFDISLDCVLKVAVGLFKSEKFRHLLLTNTNTDLSNNDKSTNISLDVRPLETPHQTCTDDVW